MAPSKPNAAADRPRDAQPAHGLDRHELSRLLVGAAAHNARERLIAGDKVDLDELVPAPAVADLSSEGRMLYAGLKVLVTDRQAPSPDAWKSKLVRLGLASATRQVEPTWQQTGDLGGRTGELAERLSQLADRRPGACVIDVTCQGNRPRVRNGEVFPPGVTIRTRVTTRKEWLQINACKFLDVEVIEGTPPNMAALLAN